MPLPIVISGNGQPILKYPDENGTFTIFHGNDLILACPGNNFTSPANIIKHTIVTTCKKGSFLYKRKAYQFDDFKCETNPKPSFLFTGEVWKVHTNRFIEVGFETDFEFQIVYKYCIEMKSKNILFSFYFVNPSKCKYRQKSVYEPTFIDPHFKEIDDIRVEYHSYSGKPVSI